MSLALDKGLAPRILRGEANLDLISLQFDNDSVPPDEKVSAVAINEGKINQRRSAYTATTKSDDNSLKSTNQGTSDLDAVGLHTAEILDMVPPLSASALSPRKRRFQKLEIKEVMEGAEE